MGQILQRYTSYKRLNNANPRRGRVELGFKVVTLLFAIIGFSERGAARLCWIQRKLGRIGDIPRAGNGVEEFSILFA